MNCPNGHENVDSATFCIQCGAPLVGVGSTTPSQGSQAESSSSPAAEFLQQVLPGDAPITAIIGYMIFTSLELSIGALMLSVLQGSFGAVASELDASGLRAGVPTRAADVMLSLFYLVYMLPTLAAWTATIGLIRRRAWAPGWTRAVQAIVVFINLLSLLMNFSPGTFLMFLFTTAAAVGIWMYLTRPEMREYFQ